LRERDSGEEETRDASSGVGEQGKEKRDRSEKLYRRHLQVSLVILTVS
jgi:hypothetical protein